MGMRLYGFWRSLASFRVRVALKLKGLPFEEIPVDILSGEQFKPDYQAVNAERVAPTLVHDGNTLFQSLAIIEYLDDRRGGKCQSRSDRRSSRCAVDLVRHQRRR